MNLSDNFTLQEMTRSLKAEELSITNTPNNDQIANLKALCENILEPLRAHFGRPIIILSGFRNQALNKAVGGAATSQHTKGEAADIEIYGVHNADIWQYIVDNLSFDQVIAEKLKENDGSAGWVHVSYSRAKLRGDAISFLGNGKYVHGLFFT